MFFEIVPKEAQDGDEIKKWVVSFYHCLSFKLGGVKQGCLKSRESKFYFQPWFSRLPPNTAALASKRQPGGIGKAQLKE